MTHPYGYPEFFLAVFVFGGGEFCYEIYQRLGFYGHSGSILYVELTKLDGLLYHSSSGLRLIHCFLNGLVRHYYDQVSLKVRTKLSGGHYQGESDLLYSQVSSFSSLEGLVDVIHWALYPIFFPDQGCTYRSYGHN